MKILFCYFNLNSPISYSFGVASLSAILKSQGYDVTVLHLNERFIDKNEQVFNQLSDIDILCLSAISSQQKYIIAFLKQLKTLNLPVITIVGGLLATFNPEAISNLCDYLVMGEAEITLPRLIKQIERGEQSDNKIMQKFYPTLFNSSPMDMEAFDYDRIIDMKRGWAEIMLSRGCPFECSYCFNQNIKKLFGQHNIRFKPIKMVIQEISNFRDLCPHLKVINFVDDNFTLNYDYLSLFLIEYTAKIGLPFLCATRSEFINKKTMDLLSRHGCRLVRMGIESGSDHLRAGELNRHCTTESILKAITLLKSYDIEIGLFNMIGIPGETEDDIRKTLELNAAIKPATSKRTILLPFPGTSIYERWKSDIDIDLLINQTNYNSCESVFTFGKQWKEMINYYGAYWDKELSLLAGIKYDYRWEDSVVCREDYYGIA